jgi:hypothetical protein
MGKTVESRTLTLEKGSARREYMIVRWELTREREQHCCFGNKRKVWVGEWGRLGEEEKQELANAYKGN